MLIALPAPCRMPPCSPCRLDGAVAEEQELEEVAAVQGSSVTCLSVITCPMLAVSAVERHRPPDDFDALGERPELHRHVDAQDLIDLELVGGRRRPA